MIHSDLTEVATRWVIRLGLDPAGRHVGRLLVETANVTPNRIRDVGVGSFVYAALFLTEGIGLLMAKRWAEWFSVIITSSLVPFEIYEIYRHPSVAKFFALLDTRSLQTLEHGGETVAFTDVERELKAFIAALWRSTPPVRSLSHAGFV